MRYPTVRQARVAGSTHAVHILNQPDKADNGWHYFPDFESAQKFMATHTDPLNRTTIDRI